SRVAAVGWRNVPLPARGAGTDSAHLQHVPGRAWVPGDRGGAYGGQGSRMGKRPGGRGGHPEDPQRAGRGRGKTADERAGRGGGAYVGRSLRGRGVLGEYQPMKGRGGRGGKRTPDGDPIPGYYPVAVTEQEWFEAQAGKKLRDRRGGRPAKHGEHVNPCAG